VLYEAYSYYNTVAGPLSYYRLGLAQMGDVDFPIVRKTNVENDDITLLYEATFGREGDIYILDRAAGTTFRATTPARLLQQLLWFLLNIPNWGSGGSQPMSIMAQGDNMLQPMQDGTPTATPSIVGGIDINNACGVTVIPSGGVKFRSQRSLSDDYALLIVATNTTGFTAINSNFDETGILGRWATIGGNPTDWLVGGNVIILANSWSMDTFGTTWLGVTLINSQGTSVEGYVVLRTPELGELVTLYCDERTLLGYNGPTPTPTVGPPPTPNPLEWYVVCNQIPGDLPPPNFVQVRTEPSLDSSTIYTLTDGEKVVRTSLDLGLEVFDQVGNQTVIFVEILWSGTSAETAWVARRNQYGDLLLPERQASCPIPTPTPAPTLTPLPTPTIDPNIPLANAGRFAVLGNGYLSPFGVNISPANVGTFGIHDNGTIDIMPQNLEKCVDTSPESVSYGLSH
jgi:hypothetical protein